MKRIISIFLIATFLMQSCVVYQSTPVALSDAVEQGNAKVITNSGEELKFQDILSKNNNVYLGVINQNKTFAFNEELVAEIYLKNEPSSNFATISLLLLTAAVGFVTLLILLLEGHIRAL